MISRIASLPSLVLPPVRSKIPICPDFICATKASMNCVGPVSWNWWPRAATPWYCMVHAPFTMTGFFPAAMSCVGTLGYAPPKRYSGIFRPEKVTVACTPFW